MAEKFKIFHDAANKMVQKNFISQNEKNRKYIEKLEKLLKEHNISIPTDEETKDASRGDPPVEALKDTSAAAISNVLTEFKKHAQPFQAQVEYKHLSYWSMIPKKEIETVGNMLKGILFGGGPKHKFHVLKDLSGKISSQKLTLLMGPPSSGKTSLLKALAGQLVLGSSHLDGEILYNGVDLRAATDKYLIGKLASYVDEKEEHAATLTVKEVCEFAFRMTSGGHHSYQMTTVPSDKEFFNQVDPFMMKVNNVLKILGIDGCANTVVGDGMLRGVSGGQKRRVTVAEMLVAPRYAGFFDSISNGLDSETTYEIIRAMKLYCSIFGTTVVISLLQPTPEVFYTFDDLMLLGSGQIIYHGPVLEVQKYFNDLGYVMPSNMDVADFLQELPTSSARRFIDESDRDDTTVPIGIDALATAWKNSALFRKLHTNDPEGGAAIKDLEKNDGIDAAAQQVQQWWPEHKERYAGSYVYAFYYCLDRQMKLTYRDTTYLQGGILSAGLVAAVAATLFLNLDTSDYNSLTGIIYFTCIQHSVSGLRLLSKTSDQRATFYKHFKALFYPASALVLSQNISGYPIQLVECAIYSIIVYWAVGMSSADNGTRFFMFYFLSMLFILALHQLYRLFSVLSPKADMAVPAAGIVMMIMVLFCGYILPKDQIPDGWMWFYYISPMSYIFKALMVNEFTASDYDFDSPEKNVRFGDFVLKSRGLPTDYSSVWIAAIIMFGEYLLFLFLAAVASNVLMFESHSMPNEDDLAGDVDVGPKIDNAEETESELAFEPKIIELAFEPIAFAFQNIQYKVKVNDGEEIDLLKGVSGFLEPGTMTALMGTSGAGKTTLLDVLSGRKNTGTILGDIFLNGKPKNDDTFRRLIGYVEQFDTLSPQDTPREAIEFSAAMRLPAGSPVKDWTTSILTMLELNAIQDNMIGTFTSGGMSFEQKKRVSIGLEIAANPAILFLDEPTTGLDSRSAQVIIRCIKRLLKGGRSVVCTIHQPSTYIFESFDYLLLLKRGGLTVFFGKLGEHCQSLISYFESAPDTKRKAENQNPATWMLQVIGAGSTQSSTVDFHEFYKGSSLSDSNKIVVSAYCTLDESKEHEAVVDTKKTVMKYYASYSSQFRYLMIRALKTYWRSPSYNFVRMIVNLLVALLFSSAYATQSYETDVQIISRVGLIYVTTFFLGVVLITTVQPVMYAQRPSFYREKYIDIYDIKLYTLANTLVELPYLATSSLFFLVPYFFLNKFDEVGVVAEQFFLYFAYVALYTGVIVFMGHFSSTLFPSEPVSTIYTGLMNSTLSLFCGFMIAYDKFPTFWSFAYWLNPFHYTLEGLVVSQFHGDDNEITTSGGPMTAENFITIFYSDWSFDHAYTNLVVLAIFIAVLRVLTYFSYKYIDHSKR